VWVGLLDHKIQLIEVRFKLGNASSSDLHIAPENPVRFIDAFVGQLNRWPRTDSLSMTSTLAAVYLPRRASGG